MDDTDAAPLPSTLSKAQRGRLKKLHKRAIRWNHNNIDDDHVVHDSTTSCTRRGNNTTTSNYVASPPPPALSGIVTLADYHELQHLLQQQSSNSNEDRAAAGKTTSATTTIPKEYSVHVRMRQKKKKKWSGGVGTATTNGTDVSELPDAGSTTNKEKAAETSHDHRSSTLVVPAVDGSSHRALLFRFVQTIQERNATTTTTASQMDTTCRTDPGTTVSTTTTTNNNGNWSSTNNNNKKKRKRRSDATASSNNSSNKSDSDASTLYNWASIHNPALISHIAVIEIHVKTYADAQTLKQLVQQHLNSGTTTLDDDDGDDGCNHVTVVPTQWFANHSNHQRKTTGCIPQSISDVLMYQPTLSVKKTENTEFQQQQRSTPKVRSMEQLNERLDEFVLSAAQLAQEGYPLTIQHEIQQSKSDATSLESTTDSMAWTALLQKCSVSSNEQCYVVPQDILLEDARQFVSEFQTTVSSVESSTPGTHPPQVPFVVSRSDLVDDIHAHIPRRQGRRIYAMDCEMVKTGMGLELARVTLCELTSISTDDDNDDTNMEDDINGTENDRCDDTRHTDSIQTKLVFDTLVRPDNPVLDYLTKYSGITASLLNPTTDPKTKKDVNDSAVVVCLEQVQAALLLNLHPNDIVIGHSLENDFKACRFVHTNVIDTALLFPKHTRQSNGSTTSDPSGVYRMGTKFSLRHLSAVLLRKSIQDATDGKSHCSVEDATTALELVVQRALRGPTFTMSNRDSTSKTQWLTPLSKQITTVAIGPVDWLRRHILQQQSSSAAHALQCESVHDSNSNAIVRWLTGPKRRAGLVWAHLHLPPHGPSSSTSNRNDDQCEWKRWDTILTQLLTQVSSQTMICIAIQIGLNRAIQLCQQRQARQENPRATIPWQPNDEAEYEAALENCRLGYVIWTGGRQETLSSSP